MKKIMIGLAAATMLTAPVMSVPGLLGPTAAHAQSVDVSMNVFFDRLSDQGSWVRRGGDTYVWVPTNVDRNWVPYSNGHWVYTEQYGWYFASDEPFAWAVYHYGRWAYDTQIGWYWVPGTRWAPAWVSWRRGDNYVGWAPLPPEGEGYSVSVTIGDPQPPAGYWVYVPVNRFAAPQLQTVIVERSQVPVLYRETQPLGPVVVQNNTVVNMVIDLNFIQQNSEEKVQVAEVKAVDNPAAAADAGETPTMFNGEMTVDQKAAPKQAAEPDQVKAPTKDQPITAEANQETQTGDQNAPASDNASPAAKDAPKAEETAPASDNASPAATEAPKTEETAPASDNASPAAKEAPKAEETAPASDNASPAAKEAPKAEETAPASDNASPAAKEAPKAEETAPASDNASPAAKDAPKAEKEAPASDNASPAAKDAPKAEKKAPASDNASPAAKDGDQGKGTENKKNKDCSKDDRAAGKC